MLKAMKENNIDVYAGVVPKGTGLYVPWGYIVVESTLNGEETSGIRWMSFHDAYTPAFKKLVTHLLPADTSKVRPGTAAHFLVKICGHLTNKPPEQLIKEELASASRKRKENSEAQGGPEAKKIGKAEE